MLEIVYKDDFLVGINKPAGLLVHRSPIAKDATQFAVQLLRDQIGCRVYPAHRLDRKTSGLLLFALDESTNKIMQQQFAEKKVQKTYWAILRGYAKDNDTIDYPLTNDDGKQQEAVTHYTTLERIEIDVPYGKHKTSRYSLIEAKPETGRMHQLRKHFAHIFHPIIGDRPHGCNKQNKLFKDKWGMTQMMLHATSLSFSHPISGTKVSLVANLSEEFCRVMHVLGFSTHPSQRSDIS